MKMFDFMLLDEWEQTDLLYRNGVYLGKQHVGGLTGVLYQMDCFYVEITYRKYRHYIQSVRCFESTGPLDPYLERIDIEALIGC